MLFVLSTLLGCKRKNEIQNKLSNYNIVDMLNSYLEYMEWGNSFSENTRPFFDVNESSFLDDSAYHGRGCKCDSDSALKIQYLRFIYTYCCRDNSNLHNKINMVSVLDTQNALQPNYITLFYFHIYKQWNLKYKNDKNSKPNNILMRFFNFLKQENISNSGKISQQNFLNYFESNDTEMQNEMIQKIILSNVSVESIGKFLQFFTMNSNDDESVGLLKKLVVKYIQECQFSSSKFWLASCIEVMIRGNNTFLQYFTANSGLLPCLLYDIIYSRSDQVQILQLSFDILGELIKFNKANFLLLNYFFNDQNEFSTFSRKVIDKKTLVDSNVFLRSVIISHSFFDENDSLLKLNKEDFFTSNCKFCTFFRENIATIFHNLIQIVKPHDINQTNISCINTALLILIQKNFQNQLGEFLMVYIYKYHLKFLIF
jgi:hypothetical protein